MLAAVLPHLRCPVCGGPFPATPSDRPRTLRCATGHKFDVARQGYVNLLAGRRPAGGDTADMVAARAEFLAHGHYEFVAEAVVRQALAAGDGTGLAVEVGAGTGYYLGAVLDALPGYAGLALDVSKYAARRAARAHPRMAAAVCDGWARLPLTDGCADVLLDVFAPRNGAEYARVLRADGVLLVVTPTRRHLAELRDVLGLLDVDPDKDARTAASLGPYFRRAAPTVHAASLRLARADVAALVAMGPSAWHTDPVTLAERIAALPEPVVATAAVHLGVYRPV